MVFCKSAKEFLLFCGRGRTSGTLMSVRTHAIDATRRLVCKLTGSLGITTRLDSGSMELVLFVYKSIFHILFPQIWFFVYIPFSMAQIVKTAFVLKTQV